MLITIQGPDVGRRFSLEAERTVIGRQNDSGILLTGSAVSRQHAVVLRRQDRWFVEDLGSSNGTFLNGIRLSPHRPFPFAERDLLQVGPYVFTLRLAAATIPTEPNLVVREKISASSLDPSFFGPDASLKLQVVLEIAKNLARTLDLEPLLEKLLEQVMTLLPQADRALVVLLEGDNLILRAQRGRGAQDPTTLPFSRTIVRRALDEGAGLLSEDVQSDERFQASQTLTNIGLHSVLCTPLLATDGKRLGVLQLDRFRPGGGFRTEDLQLLTAIGLQVGVVLENQALHAERLREERLHQELALAREIQQGLLPQELVGFPQAHFEILGRVLPARQVAGDLYDYFPTSEGKLAFFIGDVSGKGMPAALFMVMTRTLIRHLAKVPGKPSQILTRLNDALAEDNPACMFVTLAHGRYDPASGETILTSAGHPFPFLCSADGAVRQLNLPRGRLLGYGEAPIRLQETRHVLGPGDTLVFFTDGLIEARAPGTKEHFGNARLGELLARCSPSQSLETWLEQIRDALEAFTESRDFADDVTLLMLRHR